MNIDKYCKRIFELDKKNVIALVNYLMGTTFSGEEVEIIPLNKEMISDHEKAQKELQKKELDYYISLMVDENSRKIYFRVEFQSIYDKNMPIRSLKYDLESAQKEFKDGCIKMTFPLHQVIYPIEFHAKNEMKALEAYDYKGDLLFRYNMNVMKVWEYSEEKIAEHDLKILYALKPLDDAVKYQKEKITLAQYEESFRKFVEEYRESFDEEEEAMEAVKVMTNHAATIVKDKDDLEYERFVEEIVKPALETRERLKKEYRAEGRAEGKDNIIMGMMKFGMPKEHIMIIANLNEEEYEKVYENYLETLVDKDTKEILKSELEKGQSENLEFER